jgi:hypothetical protein
VTSAPETSAPETSAPETSAPETEAPVTLADGYYLVGIFTGSTDWTAKAENILTKGEGDVYTIEKTFVDGDMIKVAKVENNVITTWYKDGMDNEYTLTEEGGKTGDCIVYFNPNGNSGWSYTYLTVQKKAESSTEAQPATEASQPATEAPQSSTEVYEYVFYATVSSGKFCTMDYHVTYNDDVYDLVSYDAEWIKEIDDEDQSVSYKGTVNSTKDTVYVNVSNAEDNFRLSGKKSLVSLTLSCPAGTAPELPVLNVVRIANSAIAANNNGSSLGFTWSYSFTKVGDETPALSASGTFEGGLIKNATGMNIPAAEGEEAVPTVLSKDYYVCGWINGADYANGDDHENMGTLKIDKGTGILAVTFTQDSYIGVKSDNSNWYWTTGDDAVTETPCTLYHNSGNQKVLIPGDGTTPVVIALSENADGNLTIKCVKVVKDNK